MSEPRIPENPPAFPDSVAVDHMDGLNFSRNEGMSMRDYFAAAALTGLAKFSPISGTGEHLARFAYSVADAMLAERATGGK